ncbi:hypothetical protein HBH69_169210 [Parastagonospora nodorum]|nr:hypothetical protein HBH74_141300 [Parastagonospora nodorum]KAH4927550.1 hypothetical protein HBH73_202160 [Parastagonospora nodorum]KAH5147731.1 hypothetical protein HBH69_169210 [Parastagonospora nodorum]KAH6358218.1 hypothetical protein HBI34_211640 [Parastagonospora nodorum]
MNADTKKSIVKVVNQALRKLLRKVTAIVTTASTAARPDFVSFRHTHSLLVDELGRFNDVHAIQVFSLSWNVSIRFLIGDPDQLPPMTFGPDELNPFQKQAQLSKLTRLSATSLSMFFLSYTARFAN